jgi:hypothetical protein
MKARPIGQATPTVEELEAELEALEAENTAMRWAVWQHCELAEGKIADACLHFGIPYHKTKRTELWQSGH